MKNKTQLAKILIYVHLVFSLVFATWALGVYTQRIDWGKKAAAPGRAGGELAKRLEEIDRLGGGSREGARHRAEARWQQARTTLNRVEAQRDQNREWYTQQLLEVLLTGMLGGKPVIPPVQALVYNQGVLVLDSTTGRPQLRPVNDRTGQPLPALEPLEREYLATNEQIKATMKAIEGLVQKERERTVTIHDEGPPKGLRGQLAQEQAETEKSLAEHDYLKPLLYNRQAEVQLLLERQKALQERLKELASRSEVRQGP